MLLEIAINAELLNGEAGEEIQENYFSVINSSSSQSSVIKNVHANFEVSIKCYSTNYNNL